MDKPIKISALSWREGAHTLIKLWVNSGLATPAAIVLRNDEAKQFLAMLNQPMCDRCGRIICNERRVRGECGALDAEVDDWCHGGTNCPYAE